VVTPGSSARLRSASAGALSALSGNNGAALRDLAGKSRWKILGPWMSGSDLEPNGSLPEEWRWTEEGWWSEVASKTKEQRGNSHQVNPSKANSMNLHSSVPVFLVLITLCGCIPENEIHGPISGAQAIEGIQVAADAYAQAFLAGDPDAIAGQMTEETVASPADLANIEGRENVRRFFQNVVQNMTVTAYEFEVVEAEIFGDVAYDRGNFRWVSSWQGQTPEESFGRYSAVRHRGPDGVWRIHRFIENVGPNPQ